MLEEVVQEGHGGSLPIAFLTTAIAIDVIAFYAYTSRGMEVPADTDRDIAAAPKNGGFA